MEDYVQNLPPLNELKAQLKLIQDLRLLNDLPTLEITMSLFDPDPILARKFPPKPTLAQLCYIAEPNEEGKYDINRTSFEASKINYSPLLTSIHINPANPIAPVISYRIANINDARRNQESITPNASDLTISIPYATLRMFHVDVHVVTENPLHSNSTTDFQPDSAANNILKYLSNSLFGFQPSIPSLLLLRRNTRDTDIAKHTRPDKTMYLGILIQKITSQLEDAEMKYADAIKALEEYQFNHKE